jgi:hypothetical protein
MFTHSTAGMQAMHATDSDRHTLHGSTPLYWPDDGRLGPEHD